MQLLLTYVTGECACCGRPILFGEREHDTADGVVCGRCREEWYEKCVECGNVFHVNNLTETAISGDYVCADCRDENYVKCANCGDWCKRDDAYYMDNEDDFVCDNCYVNDYFRCDCCDVIYRIDGERHCTHDEQEICESCYEEHYFTCEGCGEIFHSDYRNWDESIDRDYCDTCYNARECVAGVYEYHDFPSSHYNARFNPYDDANERARGLLFGVELECDKGSFDIDDFTEWTDDSELIHFEHDGSLSSDGVELITQPCSLAFHQKSMNWSGLCGALVAQGFKSHATDCCGLHVHIGRGSLPPSVITKMDVFINDANRFFSAIARRSVFYSSHYTPGKKLSKKKCCHYGTSDDRYQAVNTTNTRTVEIRIFRGTLKPQTVIGTIEMLHALVGFLEQTPLARINIRELETNVRHFIDWCCERTEKYPHILPMFLALLARTEDCSDYLEIAQNWQTKINRKKEGIKKCA